MSLFFVAKLVHVLAAAMWFGVGLLVPADIRRTLALGPPHAEALVARVERTAPVVIASGLLTLVSGTVAVLLAGGFANVPRRIHVGLLPTLVIFIIGAALANPTWKQVAARCRAGELEAAQRFARRFAFYNHLEHVLWLIVLVLMVLPLG